MYYRFILYIGDIFKMIGRSGFSGLFLASLIGILGSSNGVNQSHFYRTKKEKPKQFEEQPKLSELHKSSYSNKHSGKKLSRAKRKGKK